MLLDLENKGHEVYYSAPALHTSEEFNEAYLLHRVKAPSIWTKPSEIGPLPDDRDHHVAFVPDSPLHFCSKPRPLDTLGAFEQFQESVTHSFKERSGIAMRRETLEQTARDLSKIAEKHRHISFKPKSTSRVTLEKRHPLDQIAYYSQVFLDAQLFIIGEKGDIDEPVEK